MMRRVSALPGLIRLAAVASATFDGTVKLWETSTGKLEQTITLHNKNVGVVVFSPDGTIPATAGSKKKVRLWEVSRLEQ